MSTIERDEASRTTMTWTSKGVYHFEGMWDEVVATDSSFDKTTYSRPLPTQLLRTYVDAAVGHANVRKLDGRWFSEIAGFEGVWALEDTAQEALDVLREVVYEWVLMKIRDQDRDLPVLESLDLNAL